MTDRFHYAPTKQAANPLARQSAQDEARDQRRAVEIAREHAHEDAVLRHLVERFDAGDHITRYDIGGVMRKAYTRGWITRTDDVTNPSELELVATRLLRDAGLDADGQPSNYGKPSSKRDRSSLARPVGDGWASIAEIGGREGWGVDAA